MRASLSNSQPIQNQINIQYRTDDPNYCFDYLDTYFIFCPEYINFDFVDKSPFFRFAMEEA